MTSHRDELMLFGAWRHTFVLAACSAALLLATGCPSADSNDGDEGEGEVCNDLLDNDLDGDADCDDADCVADPFCQNNGGSVGDSCEGDDDCEGDLKCFADNDDNQFCVQICDTENPDCPLGQDCVQVQDTVGFCDFRGGDPNPDPNPAPNPDMNPAPNPDMNPEPNPDPNPTPNPDMNPDMNPEPNPDMMVSVCDDACAHIGECLDEVCTETIIDPAGCVEQCDADPEGFQAELIIGLGCGDINPVLLDQVCGDPQVQEICACPGVDVEICDDGEDNDGDELADCDDDDCEFDAACVEPGDEICDDGEDNDGDELADCDDEDCVDAPNCQPDDEICDDNIDNDGDELTDCDDDDCEFDEACIEPGDEICDDNIDNDNDDFIDCDDEDCVDAPNCQPDNEICDDNIDNDEDDAVDCDDEDCVDADNCQPLVEICDDNIDNDEDDAVDCDDEDCALDDACLGDDTLAIGAPGETVNAEGSIDEDDAQWARPNADCSPTTPADHFFDAITLVNNTGADQIITVTAAWAEGDGFLHAFGSPFDPNVLDNCVVGNDDFNGLGGSQLVNLEIASGASLTILASTFDENDAIGAYTISVFTQIPPELICDDGLDDNNNGDVDCFDADCADNPVCEDFTGQICEDPFVIVQLGPIEGNADVIQDNHIGSCQPEGGPEAVWVVQFINDETVCMDTFGTAFDTALYVREADCAEGDEVACNADANDTTQSQVEFEATGGTTYFVYVEDVEAAGGDFVLNLRLTPCAQEPVDEICDDNLDNDFDGDFDCADEDCADIPDCVPGLCTNPFPILNEGDQTGDSSDAENLNQGTCGGDDAPEEVYAFGVTGPTPVCLSTAGSGFDTVLYVREVNCDEGDEVACNDDFGDNFETTSQVEFDAVPDTTYFAFVDGFDADASGAYTLNLSIGPCP